jgi:hypothetical protein
MAKQKPICSNQLHDATYLEATITAFEEQCLTDNPNPIIIPIEPCVVCGDVNSFCIRVDDVQYVRKCWKCIVQSLYQYCDIPFRFYSKTKCKIIGCENKSYQKVDFVGVVYTTCKLHTDYLQIARITIVLNRLVQSQRVTLSDHALKVRFTVLLFVRLVLCYVLDQSLGKIENEKTDLSTIINGVYIMNHSPEHAAYLVENFLHIPSPVGVFLLNMIFKGHKSGNFGCINDRKWSVEDLNDTWKTYSYAFPTIDDFFFGEKKK